MNDDNAEMIGVICGIIIVLIAIIAYFIPTFIANARKHSHRIAIFFLNLLAGGTGIGWVAAFIWAFIDKPTRIVEVSPTIGQEIKELNQLKEDGIISEAEFENKKNDLLNPNK